VGSIFEWTAKNPIFGVLPPDNFLYTPILGLFALTGLPTAGAESRIGSRSNDIGRDNGVALYSSPISPSGQFSSPKARG
jgi:hypothetical protein